MGALMSLMVDVWIRKKKEISLIIEHAQSTKYRPRF
jgi:hypothetical protein